MTSLITTSQHSLHTMLVFCSVSARTGVELGLSSTWVLVQLVEFTSTALARTLTMDSREVVVSLPGLKSTFLSVPSKTF
ncbi:hypothetical protein CROQUDRAFT_238539 [Cronartium quercuum f. sp. fusiforme G11]|uniref:Uncharacterized protein n=1 Tax=Cronartium quercuum f. sp. fusiforme G11 TaxID=708437 RepID=A0A9P6T7R8_9BASI|nr:hypothetical protein CROQUDRAFT_238539 [Cronartium quercuum f. sp. fusiforme G11]